MSHKKIDPSLRRLIDAAISGCLTEEDLRRLDDKLAHDDNALAIYLKYCQLEADLFFHGRATIAGRRVLSNLELNESSLHSIQPAFESRTTDDQLSVGMPVAISRQGARPTGQPDDESVAVAPSVEGRVKVRRRGVRRHWPLQAIAAVLLLSVGAAVGTVATRWFAANQIPEAHLAVGDSGSSSSDNTSERPGYSARLVQGTPCVWGQEIRSPLSSPNRLLSGDSLNLIAGLAELDLTWPMRGNATLRLEGPAGLVLMADGGASLNYGKLIANVSLQYESFAVETPVGRVVVTGYTHFGVAVSNGTVEIHVFSGEAEVFAPLASRGTSGDTLRVRSGRSLRLGTTDSGQVEVSRGPAVFDRFASQISMGSDLLEISDEYVRTIKQAAPLVYWRFDELTNDVLKNVMSDRYNAKVIGKLDWAEERGNMSLQLGVGVEADELRDYLVADEPFHGIGNDGYTIELWAKPSHYHSGTMVSLVNAAREAGGGAHGALVELGRAGAYYTGIEHPGRVRYLHRNPPSGDPALGTSCFSNEPYMLRKWQHIVAVKDKAQMRLYVDAKLVASAPDKTPLSDNLELLVGQIDRERDWRAFAGQLDELAFYNRALREVEIEHHYQLVRPPRVRKSSI